MRRALSLGLLSATFFSATAAAASAVLIPAGQVDLRRDLDWLNDHGVLQISTTTWPLTLAAVEEAVAAAKTRGASADDLSRLEGVRRQIARLSRPAPRLVAAYKSDNYRLPHGFAEDPRGQQELSAQTTLAWGGLAASLQGNAIREADYERNDNNGNHNFTGSVDGSYLGAVLFGQLISVGKIDRYWGPTHEGSTLLGNAAPPIAAVAIQRAEQHAPRTAWLSWIGPWTYQIFLGQQDHYEAVPHAKLFGMRVTVQPLPDFEIGVHRTMQWGGEGRPQNFSSFWDAFLGRSNTGDGLTLNQDPANQLGGFDFRWSRPFGAEGLSLYGQLTGDDEAGHLPSRNVVTAGLAYGASIGDTAVTWRLETADTRTDRFWGARNPKPELADFAYTSNVYTDGYYQRGLPLAYPIGGAGQLYKFGMEAAALSGLRYGVSLYHLEVNAQGNAINHAYPQAEKINAASLALQYPWRFVTLGGRLIAQHSDRFGSEVSGIATLAFDFDPLF